MSSDQLSIGSTSMLSSESVGHIKKLVERENWHYALAFVPNLIATNRTLQTRIAELEAIPLMQTVLEQQKQIERQQQSRVLRGALARWCER